jgi:membrane-associated HD superfamily phosphohydrolase
MSDNNSSKTNVLHLESLTKKYDTLLIQLNQAQLDYADYLNNQTLTGNNYTNINGSVFWGSGSISNSNTQVIDTLDKCSALCSSTTNCTGATFNIKDFNTPQCWLRSGDGNVITSGPNNYAIIPKSKQLLTNIKMLNSQLSKINNEILDIIKNDYPSFDDDQTNLLDKFNKLNQNYNKLELERKIILDKINQINTLDDEHNYSSLLVNKSYYTYIVFLILFCICIFILVKISMNTDYSHINLFNLLLTIILITLIIIFIIYFYKR